MSSHRQAEQSRQAQAEHEARFRLVLENLTEGAILYALVRDEQGRPYDLRYEYMNPVCRRTHWVPAERCLGRTFSEIYPDLVELGVLDRYLQVAATGEPLVAEGVHRAAQTASGPHEGYFDVRVVPLGDGVAMFYRDVSDRVRAQQALLESEARYRTALDTMTDCFALLSAIRDAAGRIIDLRYEYINQAGAEFARLPVDGIVGRRVVELFPGMANDALLDRYRRVIETGEPLDEVAWSWQHARAKGPAFTVAMDLRATRHGDGLAVAWRDVTERVRGEQALRESEELFRGGFEQSPLGNALLSPEGQCLRVNTVLAELLDTTEPRLLGHGYQTFLHPQERAAWWEWSQSLAAGHHRDASTEVRWLAENGTTVWTHVTRTVVANPAGEPWYVLLQVQDIGPRKLAEQELIRRQAELERFNRELAQFAHIASHDLQEPVRKLQVLGSRLERLAGPDTDEQIRDHAARMVSSAHRMAELIDGLLRYSRLARDGQGWQHVALGTVLQEVLGDLELPITETGAVIQSGPLPTVAGDPAQLRELFSNLLANALKFRRPGVRPEIRIDAEFREGAVEVSVRDNGIGFDPGYAERIFQPLQQLHTRAEYPGTGIGLAIAQRVAARHDMELRATGEPGRGATFVLRIPWSRLSRDAR